MTCPRIGNNRLVAIGGLLLIAIALCLLMTRKVWFGHHRSGGFDPASPRPGTVPRMKRGVRTMMP